jgi:hypothetical protein
MKVFAAFLALVLLSACSSSQVIRDSEYKYSEAAFKFSNPEKALEELPTKEQGGFVTTVEKSWLGFWAGGKDPSALQKQTRTLENRKYISISREAEYFFMSESEEGYIPAEHEIILSHIISAMYFMRAENWTEARVEVKQASYFLENFFRMDQKHFDDPALRIWIAALWAALGEWNEAQVDLRRTYEMTKDPDILPLLKGTAPPKLLSLAFDGTGPLVTWEFGNPQPIFDEKDSEPAFDITFSTLPWYRRHQDRNSVIRDKISKSNYMSQYYGIQLSKGGQKTLGAAMSTTIRVAGVAMAAAVIAAGVYILSSSPGSGEALAYPVAAGMWLGKTMWKEGDNVDNAVRQSVMETDQRGREDLKTYRFVRFLPSWISLTDTIVITATGKDVPFQAPTSRTTVHFVQRY